MGWFTRKVEPEPAPVVMEPEPEYSPIDLQLAHRIDSMQQTLDGFAAAFGSLQERIDAVEAAASLRMDSIGDDVKQANRLAMHINDEHAQIADSLVAGSECLLAFTKALDDLHRDSATAKDKIRENEIAIQQVARQRGGGGGIAGIA